MTQFEIFRFRIVAENLIFEYKTQPERAFDVRIVFYIFEIEICVIFQPILYIFLWVSDRGMRRVIHRLCGLIARKNLVSIDSAFTYSPKKIGYYYGAHFRNNVVNFVNRGRKKIVETLLWNRYDFRARSRILWFCVFQVRIGRPLDFPQNNNRITIRISTEQ